eukprot:jgi/Bigna1/143628/aug1.80_g18336
MHKNLETKPVGEWTTIEKKTLTNNISLRVLLDKVNGEGLINTEKYLEAFYRYLDHNEKSLEALRRYLSHNLKDLYSIVVDALGIQEDFWDFWPIPDLSPTKLDIERARSVLMGSQKGKRLNPELSKFANTAFPFPVDAVFKSGTLEISFQAPRSPYGDTIHRVRVDFPTGYPFNKLKCRFLTKIFHPCVMPWVKEWKIGRIGFGDSPGTIDRMILGDQYTAAYSLTHVLMDLVYFVTYPMAAMKATGHSGLNTYAEKLLKQGTFHDQALALMEATGHPGLNTYAEKLWKQVTFHNQALALIKATGHPGLNTYVEKLEQGTFQDQALYLLESGTCNRRYAKKRKFEYDART